MARCRLAFHANRRGPLGGDAVGVTSIGRLGCRTFGDMGRAARDIADRTVAERGAASTRTW